MKIQTTCLISALAFASVASLSTMPASAQGNDISYCHALAGKYQEYVGHGSAGRHGGVDDQNVDARLAVDKCNAGDASGIPVLEHALQDAKVELPAHS